MKTTELKQLIKEAVREAIQEEIKDILLEAVRAPKSVSVGQSFEQPITESKPTPPKKTIAEQRAAYQSILGDMKLGQDTLSFNSSNATAFANTLQATPNMNTSADGSALPAGNVGLDQIMGLMNKK
jgi:hypothetical protein